MHIIKVTASGRLVAQQEGSHQAIEANPAAAAWQRLFNREPAAALWQLFWQTETTSALDKLVGTPTLQFWHKLPSAILRHLLLAAASGNRLFTPAHSVASPPSLPPAQLARLCTEAQQQPWGSYLTKPLLQDICRQLVEHLLQAAAGRDLVGYLQAEQPRLYQKWQQVGQLCFHLGETGKQHEGKPPFGFLATVISGVSAEGKAQHKKLGQLIREGTKHPAFTGLMTTIKTLAERESFWRRLHEEQPIWKPQYLDAQQAFLLLETADSLSDLGIALKLPTSWQGRKPAKVQLAISVSAAEPEAGLGSWLSFRPKLLSPDGKAFDDISQLLGPSSNGQDGLIRMGDRWVQVSRHKLEELRDNWRQLMTIHQQGVPLTTAFTWLARWSADRQTQLLGLEAGGSASLDQEVAPCHPEGETQADVQINLGSALLPVLRPLLNPSSAELPQAAADILQTDFNATLRPYQRAGVAWLHHLVRHQLGGVLADDMGLGKTVQILALLTICKRIAEDQLTPTKPFRTLLIVPTSLLSNWQREASVFAPKLRFALYHGSSGSLGSGVDIVLTTYGMVARRAELTQNPWQLMVLDEAQAIKNPMTAVHQAVQQLSGGPKILLTGTPIENSLTDLWALLDTCARPLLGTWQQFRDRLAELKEDATPLKKLIAPFVLRRMKSDPEIGKELPAKIYRKVLCPLSPLQTELYQQLLKDWQPASPELEQGDQSDGSGPKHSSSRDHILTTLLKLRQICNHPDQYRKSGGFALKDSGKFYRLAKLARQIKAEGEKMLVFTAYRELTGELADLLSQVFGRDGLVLHGGISPAERGQLVEQFQQPGGPPFFVLSLRAGGTGLTLTAASHVVHFDRWWNPAIENQATDRAYRIGQTRRVLVHQFICRGTVEDRLDRLLAHKQHLATDVIDGAQSLGLDALTDDELLAALNLSSANAGLGPESAGGEDELNMRGLKKATRAKPQPSDP